MAEEQALANRYALFLVESGLAETAKLPQRLLPALRHKFQLMFFPEQFMFQVCQFVPDLRHSLSIF